MNGLTLRENIFVARYLATRNATRAAMEAYRCKNRNVAAVTGYRLLRNANVSSEIDRILDLAGMSEVAIAEKLKVVIESGVGIGAKNSQSLAGIKLALRLHGYQNI